MSTSSRLLARAAARGLNVPDPLVERLAAFYDLLFHWNRTINLTALEDSAEAIDRLVLEPLAAATFLPIGGRLADVGSGGGSPAIPLGLALAPGTLVLVESRGRKAAFLREALRQVALPGEVRQSRLEDVAGQLAGAFTLVSVRAVRLGSSELMTLKGLLAHGGEIALFRRDAPGEFELPPALVVARTHSLLAGASRLDVLRSESGA